MKNKPDIRFTFFVLGFTIGILFCISIKSFGQKDSLSKKQLDSFLSISTLSIGMSGFAIMGRTYAERTDGLYCEITIWNDSSIEIFGDTMRCIKLLLTELKRRDSVEENLYSIMGAGVEFLNHVPDYWRNSKNNPKWKRYWGLLRKQGYYQTRNKK